MTHHVNLEKILYRILLGYYPIYIDNEEYKVITPNLDIKYNAEILYDKIIEENKFDKRLLTSKEIEMQLITNGVWNPELDKRLTIVKEDIDNAKVDIYLNFLNSTKKKFLKNNLYIQEKLLNELLSKKNCLNHLSIEEHATTIKNEFILMQTIYDKTNNLVFNYNDSTIDYSKLQTFIREIVNNIITIDDIRSLIKSDIWRSYSSISNLTKDIIDINDDYKHLINFHNMYNNVRQHPECPSEDIINDDIALDGWFIHQNRKSEKEKKKNAILDKIGGNIKDKAQHIFVMTQNEEEIKAIQDLNGPEEKQFIKEVTEYSQQFPGTRWEDIPAVKRRAQLEAQQKCAINKKR